MTSYPKRFNDDGTTVTVDLHGCTVDGALNVVKRVLQEATRRGRSRVDVIHGASTSGSGEHTIKNELLDRLRRGVYREWATGHTTDAAGGRTTLWIRIGTNINSTPIRLQDVLPS